MVLKNTFFKKRNSIYIVKMGGIHLYLYIFIAIYK